MKSIVKSMAVVGQVISLLVGSNFTTPINFEMEQNPYIFLK